MRPHRKDERSSARNGSQPHPDIALRIPQFHQKTEAQTLQQRMEELRASSVSVPWKIRIWRPQSKAEELRARAWLLREVAHGRSLRFPRRETLTLFCERAYQSTALRPFAAAMLSLCVMRALVGT